MRIKFFFTAAWLLAAPSVALGSPIWWYEVPITSGSGHMSRGSGSKSDFVYGQFALFGPNISFTAYGATKYSPCTIEDYDRCKPGSTIDVEDGLGSEEYGVSGTVTIHGIETDYFALPGVAPSIDVGLSFSLALPSLGVDPQATVTLTTPFTAQVWISIPLYFPDDGAWDVEMIGQGMATVNLRLVDMGEDEGPDRFWYEYQTATYSFMPQPQPAPIPEPKAVYLLGAGMALLIFARRHCKP